MAILSLNQTIVMVVVNCIAATLSIVGSSTIIFSVRKQLRLPRQTSRRGPRGSSRQSSESRTYLRLLLSMSCFDIIASINMMVQPFLVDVKSKYPLAAGNQTTCTITGCLQQISFGGFIYYGMLSYFYLLSIRFGCTRAWIARRAEPVMHTFAIAWPVATGLLGVIMDWYSYTDLAHGCWVANYPKGCQYSHSTIECRSPVVGWSIAGCVYLLLLVSLAVNNTAVYFHVKRVYGAASSRVRNNDVENSLYFRFKTFVWRNHLRHREDSAGTTTSFREVSSGWGSDPTRQSNRSTHTVDSRELFSQNLDGGEAQRRRIRQVATQATLFVMAALATYLPLMITGGVMVSLGYTRGYQSDIFGIILAQTALSPLAGFWNAVIYFLPQFVAARRKRIRQSSRGELSGSMLSSSMKRIWSNRSGPEGSSRGFSSSFRWGLHANHKAEVELPDENPVSPTVSPTRRASSFVALDTTYMNERGITAITASMLEAAALCDGEDSSDVEQKAAQTIEPSFASVEEEKKPDYDDSDGSVSSSEKILDVCLEDFGSEGISDEEASASVEAGGGGETTCFVNDI